MRDNALAGLAVSLAVTIEEIARLAQVSRSTVSRVINNHPNVRQQVRERVLEVIREHDYAPNAAARSLASARSRVISALIPRSAAQIFADPFFPTIIQGISESSAANGYFLMLAMLTAELEQGFYNQVLRGRYVDGLIMLSHDIDDPLLPQLLRDPTPLVLIGRHPYLSGLAWVDVENRDGARQATMHLIRLGHRRIATVTGPLMMTAGLDRRDGYKQALVEAGIPIEPDLIVEGDFTEEGGYQAMRRVIALPDRPRATFVASDTMAAGALHALRQAGLRVPEDMAVVGYDDLAAAAQTSPPLTTIRQPISEMGAAAVRALIEQIEEPTAPRTAVRLATTLIIRDSCGGKLAGLS